MTIHMTPTNIQAVEVEWEPTMQLQNRVVNSSRFPVLEQLWKHKPTGTVEWRPVPLVNTGA